MSSLALQFGPEILILVMYPLLLVALLYVGYKLVQGFQEFQDARE